MDCPSCGAPLRLNDNGDFLRCEYCRTVYTPPQNDEGVRPLGEVSPLACPICKVPLEQAALGGRRILYCRTCQGILLPMEDFLGITEELRVEHPRAHAIQPAVDRGELQRHIECPQCHQRMDTHMYEGPGNIVIDDCSRCALDWLDKGELMKVARAPGRG
ncbi:MAG: zf-TFIIB domain-containing protein [Bryobacteraceae bacterium]|jgi:Zn-finger nucleic acid-binding protein